MNGISYHHNKKIKYRYAQNTVAQNEVPKSFFFFV